MAEQIINSCLFDIQVNGGNGVDLNKRTISTAEMLQLLEWEWSKGVGMILPTIISNPDEVILGALKSIVRARKDDPRVAWSVPGIHLETYVSPEDGPRGCHNKQYLRLPDWSIFCRFQDAAEGLIKMVTIAPELEGAIPFIRKLTESGVVVGIGHTAGCRSDEDDVCFWIDEAINAGASISTHLGNGSHAVMPRNSNYILYQLACEQLKASFIVDGQHLPPWMVRLFIEQIKSPINSILVSDSIFVAGLAPGNYKFGDTEIFYDGRRVSLKGTPYLAGSGLNLLQAVENTVSFTHLSLESAISMASEAPARLLGLGGKLRKYSFSYSYATMRTARRTTLVLSVDCLARCGEKLCVRQ